MNVRKFQILHRKSTIGRLLRYPLKLIPSGTILPILSGPLRGNSWINGSHNFSVFLGIYERFQSQEFYNLSSGVKVFWDLGAHVGYYSLLFRRASVAGKIIAFEPVERNCNLFIRHMSLNHVSNYTLHKTGASDRAGSLSFNSGRTTVAGRLDPNGNTSVQVIKLSAWLEERKIEVPQLIKMDIEGEEYKVLKDIAAMIGKYKPIIFLSTHGNDVHNACISLLREYRYSFKPLDTRDLDTCKEVLAY